MQLDLSQRWVWLMQQNETLWVGWEPFLKKVCNYSAESHLNVAFLKKSSAKKLLVLLVVGFVSKVCLNISVHDFTSRHNGQINWKVFGKGLENTFFKKGFPRIKIPSWIVIPIPNQSAISLHGSGWHRRQLLNVQTTYVCVTSSLPPWFHLWFENGITSTTLGQINFAWLFSIG